jgi:hypothetical protein
MKTNINPTPVSQCSHTWPARWLLVPALFSTCLTAGIGARAGDAIAQAGDVLQFVLPGTAAGLTLGYWDGKGAL